MVFWLFLLFIIGLRMAELLLARRNEQWLLKHGAVEYGQAHYPVIVGLHILFLLSLIIEYILRGTDQFNPYLLGMFFLLLAFKGWVIGSLGKFWNTKIYRVPDFPLVKKGPYKFIRHPNYIIVILEIALIPLIFHLYYTAILFTVLNAAVLYIRIREENKALQL
ncbi:MAG: hypothetical protein LUG98_11870 [Tannerellaceae bacterium]|nr:hypothetical protein [Tannerellaceae bacterium]